MSKDKEERIPGAELGLRLCAALGLDSKNVRSLTLRCEVGKAAIVELELFVERGAVPEKALRGYELVRSAERKGGKDDDQSTTGSL